MNADTALICDKKDLISAIMSDGHGPIINDPIIITTRHCEATAYQSWNEAERR
jgi:hypothetical protein